MACAGAGRGGWACGLDGRSDADPDGRAGAARLTSPAWACGMAVGPGAMEPGGPTRETSMYTAILPRGRAMAPRPFDKAGGHSAPVVIGRDLPCREVVSVTPDPSPAPDASGQRGGA